MQFLLQHMKHKSRDNIKSLLRNKQIYVNGQVVSQFNYVLHPGQQIVIRADRAIEGTVSRDFRIIYEDEFILVIDKQAGLLSISDGGGHATAYSLLSEYVKRQNPSNKIFIVHRLDRDTSGLMMFARSEEVQRILQRSWQTSIKERTYVAVVEGKVEMLAGTISSYLYESKALIMHSSQDPEKGELSVTHYKTLKSNPEFSLLELKLQTGKKNQIRVHMQDIGHSITGDKKYGASSNPVRRLCLHASVLAFQHPVTGKPLRFESKIPASFLRLL